MLPLSHVTAPKLLTIINLYSKYVPGAKLIVADLKGFELVYLLALNGTPFAVFQLPRAAIDPTILILVPYIVVTNSLNVTATEEQPVGAVVLVVGAVVLVVGTVVLVVGTVVLVLPEVVAVATVENVVDTVALVDDTKQSRDSVSAQFSRRLHYDDCRGVGRQTNQRAADTAPRQVRRGVKHARQTTRHSDNDIP